MADLATITADDLNKLGITEQMHVDTMLICIGQRVQNVEDGSRLGSPRQSTNVYGDENEPLPLCAEEV